MEHSRKPESERLRPAATRVSSGLSPTLTVTRPDAFARQALGRSPQVTAQRATNAAVRESPYVVAQRKRLRGMFGAATQLRDSLDQTGEPPAVVESAQHVVQRMKLDGSELSELEDSEVVEKLTKVLKRKAATKYFRELSPDDYIELSQRIRRIDVRKFGSEVGEALTTVDAMGAIKPDVGKAEKKEAIGAAMGLVEENPADDEAKARGARLIIAELDKVDQKQASELAVRVKGRRETIPAFKLYRKMSKGEAEVALESQKLPERIWGSEFLKWMAESPEKARQFSNKGSSDSSDVVLVFYVSGDEYLHFRKKAIPQLGTAEVIDKVIYHREGLAKDSELINVGMPPALVPEFNKSVVKVELV